MYSWLMEACSIQHKGRGGTKLIMQQPSLLVRMQRTLTERAKDMRYEDTV